MPALSVQLAAYRLAWAALVGEPLERVRAAFHYVRHDHTLRPADLLGEEGAEGPDPVRGVLTRGVVTRGGRDGGVVTRGVVTRGVVMGESWFGVSLPAVVGVPSLVTMVGCARRKQVSVAGPWAVRAW